jgi:hypothetical protein
MSTEQEKYYARLNREAENTARERKYAEKQQRKERIAREREEAYERSREIEAYAYTPPGYPDC